MAVFHWPGDQSDHSFSPALRGVAWRKRRRGAEALSLWSGLIFSITFVVSAEVAPLAGYRRVFFAIALMVLFNVLLLRWFYRRPKIVLAQPLHAEQDNQE